MMGNRRFFVLMVVVGLILINACSIGAVQQPAAAVQPVPIDEGAALIPTSTRPSFPTAIPTMTYTPQPTIQVCDANAAIDMMEKLIPYSEYEIYYFSEDGISNLIVWFVDHQLNLSASEGAFSENVQLSQDHAIMLAQQLNFAEPCMGILFDKIGVTVADQYYNAWFEGKIHTAILPDDIVTDQDQVKLLINQFEVTYLRNGIVKAIPAGPADSCTWKEAHQNILSHMNPNAKNNAFFYADSLLGRTVVAQWEGNIADVASDAYLTTLEYIGDEIKCLYPEPSLVIYYLVDEDATAIAGGIWYLWDPKNPDLNYNIPYLID